LVGGMENVGILNVRRGLLASTIVTFFRRRRRRGSTVFGGDDILLPTLVSRRGERRQSFIFRGDSDDFGHNTTSGHAECLNVVYILVRST
jgi:hypothetical protein